MQLSTDAMKLLIYLDEQRLAGNVWVKLNGDCPAQLRKSLQNAGLIEGEGKTSKRVYRITEAGTRAFFNGDSPDEPPRKTSTLGIRPYKEVRVEQEANLPANGHIAPSSTPSLNSERGQGGEVRICPPCTPQSCVHRQALDILIQRIPEARDLVTLLEKLNRFQSEG